MEAKLRLNKSIEEISRSKIKVYSEIHRFRILEKLRMLLRTNYKICRRGCQIWRSEAKRSRIPTNRRQTFADSKMLRNVPGKAVTELTFGAEMIFNATSAVFFVFSSGRKWTLVDCFASTRLTFQSVDPFEEVNFEPPQKLQKEIFFNCETGLSLFGTFQLFLPCPQLVLQLQLRSLTKIIMPRKEKSSWIQFYYL